MDRLPPDWIELPMYHRDVLLALAAHGPLGYDALWTAVGEVHGRGSKSYLRQVLSTLESEGLIERTARGDGGPHATAEYALSAAGRERVEALQALLWDVATA